ASFCDKILRFFRFIAPEKTSEFDVFISIFHCKSNAAFFVSNEESIFFTHNSIFSKREISGLILFPTK
ncbi:MAG: hypothetical protein ACPHY8_06345, partial [Patescibacteria group bacterium]